METTPRVGLLRNQSSPNRIVVPIATAAEPTTNRTPSQDHTHSQVKGRFQRLPRENDKTKMNLVVLVTGTWRYLGRLYTHTFVYAWTIIKLHP